MNNSATPLNIAVRVYPDSQDDRKKKNKSIRRWKRPEEMFVFDTETRTDATQRLMFGAYRFIHAGQCLEDGLFYAADLPEHNRNVLQQYVDAHRAETVAEGARELRLLTRDDFLERLFRAAYKGHCLLVGFNLPFDISRIAYDSTTARGRFAGGFSLGLWSYNKNGLERRDQYRPRVGIKHIDSKRALKGFTARNSPDVSDLIPDGSETGKPEAGHIFRGHFLDLRTLAFALTDSGYSLETACEAFAVKNGKTKSTAHGIVTEEYIDYNRRDVSATAELAIKLLEEYDRHPIELQVTKAYSPASLGKAYLRAMGIVPILQRQPDFPKEFLGYAQSAFFGGRASAHIRKIPVPVVYTDFLSMYPTVNSLMNLWRFVTARRIKVIQHCGEEIHLFLKRIVADELFNPNTWKHLTAFVQIIPNGDILPTRGKYSVESNDWQVAVNCLHANKEKRGEQGLWYSLPDVVGSVLLTGRVPEIVNAFRLEPVGILPDLKSTLLRGKIPIDPRSQDFFRVVIEERKRLSSRTDISNEENARLEKALKVVANAASYGIYAEMNRQETEEKIRTTCHGIDAEPFTCTVAHPDVPGEYCFPPLASLITGAARLMLALLEHGVTRLGGTYAMEDTDSMAIVATESGGLVPCPGGPLRTADGQEAIKALSWKEVGGIRDRFAALNPYSRDAIPGSVLKIEDVNFEAGKQRQLYCMAISAKRYALFERDESGRPILAKHSDHGLGHLLNPTDPESEDRDWVAQVWLNMIRSTLGLHTEPLPFTDLPAVGRVTLSSPVVMKAFAAFNGGRPYADQIKPFNFLLACQVKQFGYPTGADPARFHLITPFELNPQKWLTGKWIDQYTGKQYRITMRGHHGTRTTARVKTYGEILEEYEFHPEGKCADANGTACGKRTVGLLQRRHIEIDLIKYIGKESNCLEEVEEGAIHSADAVYTEYPDPQRDEWQKKILPALKKMPLSELVRVSRMSRRALMDLRAGRSRPHPRHEQLLKGIVTNLMKEK